MTIYVREPSKRAIERRKRDAELRHRYPYGLWTCADGQQVLFNRDYCPIWKRYPGQPATSFDHHAWIPWKKQEWFFNDYAPPWARTGDRKRRAAVKQTIARCEAVLAEWGIQDGIIAGA